MSRSARVFFVAAVLAAWLGCASDDKVPVSSGYDALYRFPAQASFAWDERAISLPEDPDVDRASTDALLKQVIGDAFAAHGYKLAGIEAPYRLSYQYSVNRRTSADESFAMGTLSLILTERGTNRRLWTGFGQAEIYQGLTPDERRTRLRAAMDRMLVSFPPTHRPE